MALSHVTLPLSAHTSDSWRVHILDTLNCINTRFQRLVDILLVVLVA